MRMSSILFLLVLLGAMAAYALPGAGFYIMSDIIVRHVPSDKPNGSAWDPMGGAPDLFLRISIAYGRDEEALQSSTTAKDNCGSSAIWSRSEDFFVDRADSHSDDVDLLIELWDEDMSSHDLVDVGRVSLSDLEIGSVEIEMSFGTEISFELDGPYEN